MKAVITGDIIGSSKLSSDHRVLLYETQKDLITELNDLGHEFALYRGDSIQGVIERPSEALSIALRIKSKIKAIYPEKEEKEQENSRKKKPGRRPVSDIRLSIGIGDIGFQADTVKESDGSAFRHSGHSLDEMKAQRRTLSLTTGDAPLDETWDVILALLDQLMEKWTYSSAELIYELLLGEKEVDISEKLSISQPAVNHRKRYASWDAIKAMLSLYDRQIKAYDE